MSISHTHTCIYCMFSVYLDQIDCCGKALSLCNTFMDCVNGEYTCNGMFIQQPTHTSSPIHTNMCAFTHSHTDTYTHWVVTDKEKGVLAVSLVVLVFQRKWCLFI